MKKIISLAFLTIGLLIGNFCHAQTAQIVILDASSNGTVVTLNGETATALYDDGGLAGYYTANQDYYVTFTYDCGGLRLSVEIIDLDVARTDTIYVYDGADTNGILLAKINSYNGDWLNRLVFVSPAESTNQITIRFRASANSVTAGGFNLKIGCNRPCEKVVPVIDDAFYRTRGGEIYDTAYLQQVPVYDTSYVINSDGDTVGIDHIDTNYFTGANLCIGDGVIFVGHGEYTHEYGYYNPNDNTSFFKWNMGFESDTIVGVGQTQASYDKYQNTGCYDVTLSMIDEFGCVSTVYTTIKVRTAFNPIKTIFSLESICNRDSLLVNMGYDGENATLTLRKIEAVNVVSKINEVRTFIPDGKCPMPNDPSSLSDCYEAPVTFNEFPSSRIVQSKEDICSICINMEHTFMGDVTVSLVCPTGQEAKLFYSNRDTPPSDTNRDGTPWSGTQGGGGKHMGYPIRTPDGTNKCDSLESPFGVGLDYCWSRNADYTLVTGDNAAIDEHPAGDFYIVSNGFMDSYTETIPTIPSYFTNGGGTSPTVSGTTKHPSDHENRVDYYLPFSDFSELVGCPLNGTWAIKVCDLWAADNGWLFNWTMDICDVTKNNDCRYQVGIDSLIWRPNPDAQYHDYDLGKYRGLEVKQATPTISYILSRDTAGTFPIDVLVYDEFGCVWDTNTRITTYWTPQPNLGADTGLCGDTQMILDGGDRHANSASENYSYLWEPYGQQTQTITTTDEAGSDINYVVRTTNTHGSGDHKKDCQTRDTINVKLLRQPLPSFLPAPYQLEGCAPLTLNFQNQSLDGEKYLWVFGDGITSSLENPSHTYDEGVYDLKYYVTSADGCTDSVILPQTIAAFSAPKSAFTWEPTYPSVMNPVVNLINNTVPHTPANKYYWEIQYNLNNPLSVETKTTYNTTFDFSQYATDENVAGNYTVRLIARTDNVAPSGNIIYCPDTTENTILVINDFLQFPNVVTPNGDGINDLFIIKGLVEGMGYPINSLDIYNKWGTLVFHRTNISSMDDFWDPSNVPSGTYFYRFSAHGYNGNVEHNGAIEVIKD